jgi:hypothetical protein
MVMHQRHRSTRRNRGRQFFGDGQFQIRPEPETKYIRAS